MRDTRPIQIGTPTVRRRIQIGTATVYRVIDNDTDEVVFESLDIAEAQQVADEENN